MLPLCYEARSYKLYQLPIAHNFNFEIRPRAGLAVIKFVQSMACDISKFPA